MYDTHIDMKGEDGAEVGSRTARAPSGQTRREEAGRPRFGAGTTGPGWRGGCAKDESTVRFPLTQDCTASRTKDKEGQRAYTTTNGDKSRAKKG